MCGVFGIYGHPEAANLTYLGLHALQHRGQEAAGIVTTEGRVLYSHRGEGLVHEVFNEAAIGRLPGHAAIGHTRYSTAGGGGLRNTQPFAFEYALGALAVAHNGNLTNAQELRAELEQKGAIFQSSSDTETLVHLIAHSPQRKVEDRIVDALLRVEGAYSLVFLTPDRLVAVRDPAGVRPLCVGRLRTPEQAYVVASEPTCFDLINASFERYLAPGEVFTVDARGARSSFPLPGRRPALCVFEYVYFARPDSMLGSASVYEVRKELGRRLAVEHPAEADLVLPVPDSGVPAALGYAEQMKLPFELGLIRSHYVGRTFIEPRQSIRHFGVRLKLNPVGDVLRGKRVVVVDDSIVRGTTSRKIVKMLRDAGAREVHVRISSPPTQWPCFYGIDTPTRGELIASTHTVAETVRYLTADSLGYLSREGLSQAVSAVSTPLSGGGAGLCDACFSGNYPIPIVEPAAPHRQLPLLQV
ncbi:MAG TPA: amidophosphoribosyltransferase [Polyangiaceae bacterium]|nr:amidophosphoribosyltransferase [Polyangiaceae bacterium]